MEATSFQERATGTSFYHCFKFYVSIVKTLTDTLVRAVKSQWQWKSSNQRWLFLLLPGNIFHLMAPAVFMELSDRTYIFFFFFLSSSKCSLKNQVVKNRWSLPTILNKNNLICFLSVVNSDVSFSSSKSSHGIQLYFNWNVLWSIHSLHADDPWGFQLHNLLCASVVTGPVWVFSLWMTSGNYCSLSWNPAFSRVVALLFSAPGVPRGSDVSQGSLDFVSKL